jgi:hypothetical protein
MGNIITSETIVKPPFDKFWDNPPTRRELQRALNKIAENESEMMGMCDTAALILNYICEVALKIKREDIEVYVEAKKLQLAEMRAKMKAEAEAVKAEG